MDADLVLVTPRPRAAGSAVTAVVMALVVGGVGWGMWRLADASGRVRWTAWVLLGVVGLVALRALAVHLRQVGTWLRWRGRPLPALRLTASGLDYSAAYTGEFELHVSWAVPMTCAYRQGVDNTGFFWCLYAPVIEGLDGRPAFLPREWPLDPDEMRAERQQLAKAAGVEADSPVLLHLVTYGTPIVINPYLLPADLVDAADERLRAHTDGRCTLRPPEHRVGPTTRSKIF
ncbi:hypothetical protein [Asanoa hainanensis]|nr:hypothetical protein [Asanoa hainanensis]